MAAMGFYEHRWTELGLPAAPLWVGLLEPSTEMQVRLLFNTSSPASLWNTRTARFRLRLAHTISRTKTCRERKARVASCSVALREAPASWTFIKNLPCASSFRESLAKESRKPSFSTPLVVLREVIDLKQV